MNWQDYEDELLKINTQVVSAPPPIQHIPRPKTEKAPEEEDGDKGLFSGLKGLVGGGSGGESADGLGAALSSFSDKRLKKDVKPAQEKDVMEMIKCLLDEMKEKK
jgi:hypothetical protein